MSSIRSAPTNRKLPLYPRCPPSPSQFLPLAVCPFIPTSNTFSCPRKTRPPSLKQMKRFYSLRSGWRIVISNSRRSCQSQRLNFSLCLSTHMGASLQPSGPWRSPSAMKHLPRRWRSYIQTRREQRNNNNNRIKISHKRSPRWIRRLLFPVGRSPPANMPERLGYPPVAASRLGCGCQRRPDCDSLYTASSFHYHLHCAPCCSYPVSSVLSNLYLIASKCFPLLL